MNKNGILSSVAAGLVLSWGSQSFASSNEGAAGEQSFASSSESASANQSFASSDHSADRSIAASTNTSSTKPKSSAGKPGFFKLALGVATGIIVGTPVCMVRKPIDDSKDEVADITGENNHKPRCVIPAAALWAPFALVQGVFEAPFWAVNNSLVNYDKPFSKEQCSLAEKSTSSK